MEMIKSTLIGIVLGHYYHKENNLVVFCVFIVNKIVKSQLLSTVDSRRYKSYTNDACVIG